jgi:hypothetical protein
MVDDIDSDWHDLIDSIDSSDSATTNSASYLSYYSSSRVVRPNVISARQKSPGPEVYPISRARRNVIFLEKDRAPIRGLPIIRLDPFLARHIMRHRVRSGPCPQRQRNFGKRISLAELKCGSFRGCPYCVLGYFSVTAFQTQKLPSNTSLDGRKYGVKDFHSRLGRTDDFELYTISTDLEDVIALPCLWPKKGYLERTGEWWSFYGNRVPACIARNAFPGDTSSTHTVKTVLRWLHECDLWHSKCRNRGPYFYLPRPHFYPTRLIDVSAMRLCETQTWNTAELSVPYACLSHCWGSYSQASFFLRPPTATLALHKEKIPMEKLPRTFLEALQFTSALGIPYLWIDSLCIVQDVKLDWEKEGAAMADIYMNCRICLAASLSSNSEGGLFARRGVGSCRVGIVHFPRGPSLPLYARERPTHNMRPRKYPLMDRAWVVQETFLSPRSLYFIDAEVIFECREDITCECGGVRAQRDWPRRFSGQPDSSPVWQEVVKLYTKTSLTFSRDKLPALSGLAKQWLSNHPHDVYLAGLWRSTLPEDLLWYSRTPLRSRTRPWRAPSWSWVSIDTTVTYFEDLTSFHDPMVKIIDAHCTPSGADPTGTVAFGHLLLRGKALDASIHYRYTNDRMRRSVENAEEWSEYENDADDPISVRIDIGLFDFSCWLDIPTWKPGRDYVKQGSKVKLLFIYGPDPPTVISNRGGFFRLDLLVLKPLFADTFERIGIASRHGGHSLNARAAAHANSLLEMFNETPDADYFIV